MQPTTFTKTEGEQFHSVKFFADTLAGPLVALYERNTDMVQVIVRKPGDAIMRTAREIVDEVRADLSARAA